jgi:protein-L-isoaspartate(D-aspartate) O-methyltransferase
VLQADVQRFDDLRREMVERQLRRRGIRDERVLAAFEWVPRHAFVPDALRGRAYEDTPLPIGHGQTISQPLMVAEMLEAMELGGDERVLEVGAGCGYQAALLGCLAKEVFAVEIVVPLVERARVHLGRIGFANVHVVCSDGSMGYEPAAPYDAIVVAAAAPALPPPLVDQLVTGGRLLIPVGDMFGQVLVRVRKLEDGGITTERLTACAFVPLVGAYGQHGEAS